MTLPKPVRNVYCTHPNDMVVPFKCACCDKCWLFVEGPHRGSCPFGGPYDGYEIVK